MGQHIPVVNKHTFVCSQIVSVSLLKRFTLRALTAAESFVNVTADMARDFVFGFRSMISMHSFVAAASSLSTAKTFVPQWTIKAVFPSMWPDARNSFALLWISLILAPREHSTIVFPLQARDNYLPLLVYSLWNVCSPLLGFFQFGNFTFMKRVLTLPS